MQKLLLAVAASGLVLSALADPKAYDLVKYRASVGGVEIAFDFADGYPEASQVRVTEKGKRSLFLLDDSGTMRFIREKQKAHNGGREVVLKMSPEDAAPKTVEGTYRSDERTVRFTLKRQ